jgi:carboxypeptidase family protein/ankyrin repeat protein
MPARDLYKLIEVKTPCTADWDSMIGNDHVRFCEHCNLTVNDLSNLTPKRVQRLITKSKGRLCVRYQRRPDGSPILKTLPAKLHTIGRRATRIAAGAFSATLSLSSAVSQSATNNVRHERVIAYRQLGSGLEPITFGSAIKGKVTDTTGAVIQGAGVTLSTTEIAYFSGTTTDAAGEYSFDGLQPGTYRLTIEATGFAKNEVGGVTLTTNETQTIDSSLEVAVIQAEVTVIAEDVVVEGGAIVILPAQPLIAAAQSDDLEGVQALLTRDNVNLRDESIGSTALEHAVRHGNREMVQLLLSAGADVNSRNQSKETVLMMLGDESTAEIVWDLIHAGAKVDLKDEDGDTALIEAAMEKNLPVLIALIHAGARVDARNKQGQTALMLAASNNQIANIRALVRAGADMNARDNEGKTTLDYAIEEGNEKIINMLQSYGAIVGEMPKEN